MAANIEKANRLQAEAYAISSIEPTDLGPAIEGIVYGFSVVCTVIVGLRAYERFVRRSNLWGWDDILAVVGYLAFIPSNVFAVLSTRYGMGARDSSLEALGREHLLAIRAVEYFMYYEILYFAASAVIKVAITLTVLRLCDQHPIYRKIAIANAVVMIASAGGAGIFMLANCRPWSVYWNPDSGVCTYGPRGFESLYYVSMVGSCFQVLSDWVSALLPLVIIWRLQMKRRRKIILISILGIGVMASIAALVRMMFYRYWKLGNHTQSQAFYGTGVIVLTSELEVGLGIFASSLPPLGTPLQNLIRRIRSRTSHSGGAEASLKGTQLSTLKRQSIISNPRRGTPNEQGTGRWNRLGDEDDSESGLNPETVVPFNRIKCETRTQVESKVLEEEDLEEMVRRKLAISW
ncbi:hypothetical protein F4780DRAFT_784539 [Xylariomycetidae sp. FL0641]|nr:hypothetical protein F4780DRAFT_784539 [Xylariomycetidae sp. FL0641]